MCLPWLHGKCSRADCKQQHARRPELMPNCVHFMMGRCDRSDCPYSHAIVHPDAPLCSSFSLGYCSNGSRCPRKHFTPKMLGYQELSTNNGSRRLGTGGVGGWGICWISKDFCESSMSSACTHTLALLASIIIL